MWLFEEGNHGEYVDPEAHQKYEVASSTRDGLRAGSDNRQTLERKERRSATPTVARHAAPHLLPKNPSKGLFSYCLGGPPLPPPFAAGGGSVPPSARIFIFSSALVNCAALRILSCSRAASSASVELSRTSV